MSEFLQFQSKFYSYLFDIKEFITVLLLVFLFPSSFDKRSQ